MDLLDKFKTMLKEKGYKVTIQREKILNIIIENEDKQLTSEEIYNIIKKDCDSMGIATIYRTMHIFEDANIVCKFDNDENGVRYELIDINEKYQHPHFICQKCGEIFAVKDFDLNLIENELDKNYDFKIINYDIKLYGICPRCSKNSEMLSDCI